MSKLIDEQMLQNYLHETSRLLDKIEGLVITNETDDNFRSLIDAIFGDIHTIKGSSSLMEQDHITEVVNCLENMLSLIKDNDKFDISLASDLILQSIDYMKVSLLHLANDEKVIDDYSAIVEEVKNLCASFRQTEDKGDHEIIDNHDDYLIFNPSIFSVSLDFQEGCEMENVRAYTLCESLKAISDDLISKPMYLLDEEVIEVIREEGLQLHLKTKERKEVIENIINESIFLENYKIEEILEEQFGGFIEANDQVMPQEEPVVIVSLKEMDQLMNMVGELVIAESMVTQHPDVKRMHIESFEKSGRHLRKISNDIQSMIMTIRMMSIGDTFRRLEAYAYEFAHGLNKDIHVELVGQMTEIDKSIVDIIVDPFKRIITSYIENDLSGSEIRLALEAKKLGSDVLVSISDRVGGLTTEELSTIGYEKITNSRAVSIDLDISQPLSEFSQIKRLASIGKFQNINQVGGTCSLVSGEDGLSFEFRFPLSLAIINGMNLRVGESRFTLPLLSIKESFRPKKDEVFSDPLGREMIMLRGSCYPVLRLHDYYKLQTSIKDCHEGILIMIEENEDVYCLMADELLGQQQVVVKTLPEYIKKTRQIKGVSGCTLLGDGHISLILDVKSLGVNQMEVKQ